MQSRPAPFSILSAPVANCDRRALSEAWYSALHVHKESTQPSPVSHPSAAPGSRSVPLPHGARIHPCGAQAGASPAVRASAAATPPGTPALERRATRSKLAQDIERVFVRSARPPRHASFSLGTGRGRVQILLRERGSSMQILALCPPAAHDTVARALGQARYALALRGISMRADVRGFAR